MSELEFNMAATSAPIDHLAVIFDMDHSLSLDTNIVLMLKTLRQKFAVVIMAGKCFEDFREQLVSRLKVSDVHYDHLILRASNNKVSGVNWRREQLLDIKHVGFVPMLVVSNQRDRITESVKVYRESGLPILFALPED